MQLGKELATGFVADDVQAAPDEAASLPPRAAEAKAPETTTPEAAHPEPEPAAAG